MDSQNHFGAYDEPFSPDTVDQQIDELLLVAPQHEGTVRNEAQLVQDVKAVAHEYAALRDRVWGRLQTRSEEANALAQVRGSGKTSKKPAVSIERERVPFMTQDHRYPKRTGIHRLAVLAAACIMALIVGSLIFVLSVAHRPNTQTGGGSPATPTTVATQPGVSGGQPFCDKRDLGWYAICSNHEEQVVNIKKTIGNNVFTIQTVYADMNRVLLTYTDTSPVTGSHLPNTASFTLSAQHGITLAQIGDAGNFNEKTGFSDGVASFDIAQVPANTEALNLHMQVTLYSGMSHHQLGGFSGGFSATLHAGRVTTWNQTVTVNGIAITLQRVVVSPSQTRLYVLSPRLRLTGDPQHSPYTLAVGNWNNYVRGFDDEGLITQGNGGSIIGARLIVNASLFDQYGEWTFKITSGAVIGGSGTWVFHFVVPK